jgi:hypothetical protein
VLSEKAIAHTLNLGNDILNSTSQLLLKNSNCCWLVAENYRIEEGFLQLKKECEKYEHSIKHVQCIVHDQIDLDNDYFKTNWRHDVENVRKVFSERC